MSLLNRRSAKALASAAVITLGFLFFLQSSRPSIVSGSQRELDTLHTETESATASSIPEKIWYKAGPKGIDNEIQEWMNTCLEKNPTFEYQILTDSSAEAYVIEKFSHRPDIVKTYLALPIPIVKADLLRYLLLFADGGLWSDLDVSCGDTPIREWIPQEYRQNTSLVVGWEFQTVEGAGSMREFASWMIMAKPGSRHMSMVIDDIVETLHGKASEHNVSLSGLTMDNIGDVVWVTGPMAMSKSIIKSLGIEDQEINMGTSPYVVEPQLFDDVLVLPGSAFSASLQKYKDYEHPGPSLVVHHFLGSWKNDAGGEGVEATP